MRHSRQGLASRFPVLRAHGHKYVALGPGNVSDRPLDPFARQRPDDPLRLRVRERAHGERPVQRPSEPSGQILRLDELEQFRRRLGRGEHEDLRHGRGVEPPGREAPDGGEEVGRADDEDAGHRLGIVRVGHAAGGLQEGSQGPEFAQPDVGEVDDVDGFVDGGAVVLHPVAETLGEVGEVFGREEDAGEAGVFLCDLGEVFGRDLGHDVDHERDPHFVSTACPLGLLGESCEWGL